MMPTPVTISEVKSLLGKFAYYKRLIEGFSSIAKPVIQPYTEAGNPFYKKIKRSSKKTETTRKKLK